jgi:hypothetical protein
MPERHLTTKTLSAILAAIYLAWSAQSAAGYAFNLVVPDVRQPVAMSGGSACPVRAHQLTAASSISLRWSIALGINPVSILTQNQTAALRLTEIEQVITQSLAVWTAAPGTTLIPATINPPQRTATQNACNSDGLNSICFDQPDMAFTPGVLAFTRSSPRTLSASKSAAAPPPRSLAKFSTPTSISIPPTPK